jgi:enoyl-CoA hydratase
MAYENIQVETRDGVGVITLDRPQALNALCVALIDELGQAIDAFEADDGVGCMLLTGSEKAFAAGADIKEMQDKTFMQAYLEDFITKGWERLSQTRKPVIAAVAGYALGGGCEIAMMCDMIIAADTARFGQPEITLGTIPGAGGTQRLTRSVGKAKAMDLCLTGRMMDAEEAERAGLVARVVPAAELMDEAMKAAAKVASLSRPRSIGPTKRRWPRASGSSAGHSTPLSPWKTARRAWPPSSRSASRRGKTAEKGPVPGPPRGAFGRLDGTPSRGYNPGLLCDNCYRMGRQAWRTTSPLRSGSGGTHAAPRSTGRGSAGSAPS